MCRRECASVSRAGRRMKEDSEIDGWSISRCPTPGNAERTSIPISRRWPIGPDAVAQQDGRRMDGAGGEDHLRPAELLRLPFTMAETPTQRLPSKSRPLTWVSVEMVRFCRARTWAFR